MNWGKDRDKVADVMRPLLRASFTALHVFKTEGWYCKLERKEDVMQRRDVISLVEAVLLLLIIRELGKLLS